MRRVCAQDASAARETQRIRAKHKGEATPQGGTSARRVRALRSAVTGSCKLVRTANSPAAPSRAVTRKIGLRGLRQALRVVCAHDAWDARTPRHLGAHPGREQHPQGSSAHRAVRVVCAHDAWDARTSRHLGAHPGREQDHDSALYVSTNPDRPVETLGSVYGRTAGAGYRRQPLHKAQENAMASRGTTGFGGADQGRRTNQREARRNKGLAKSIGGWRKGKQCALAPDSCC